MLFSKFVGLFLLCFTIIVVACPIPETATESDGLEVNIAPIPFNLDLPPVSYFFVRYIHSCDAGRLEVTEIVCGGKELAVV